MKGFMQYITRLFMGGRAVAEPTIPERDEKEAQQMQEVRNLLARLQTDIYHMERRREERKSTS